MFLPPPNTFPFFLTLSYFSLSLYFIFALVYLFTTCLPSNELVIVNSRPLGTLCVLVDSAKQVLITSLLN